MSDITFYTNPQSTIHNPQSRGQIVHWMLEELGIPYDTQWVEYGEQMKSAEYLAVNPMGKVPAIKHKNALITEGVAISLTSSGQVVERFTRVSEEQIVYAFTVDDPEYYSQP